MMGKTNAVLVLCVGENMPNPPYDGGIVAIVWAYFDRAALHKAVWRTEHVVASILLANREFQLCVPLYASVSAKYATLVLMWNGIHYRMLSKYNCVAIWGSGIVEKMELSEPIGVPTMVRPSVTSPSFKRAS
eukprot:14723283-Ditylum_brightwellii.AAC.1